MKKNGVWLQVNWTSNILGQPHGISEVFATYTDRE